MAMITTLPPDRITRNHLPAALDTSPSSVQPPPPSAMPCCSFRPPSAVFGADLLRYLWSSVPTARQRHGLFRLLPGRHPLPPAIRAVADTPSCVPRPHRLALAHHDSSRRGQPLPKFTRAPLTTEIERRLLPASSLPVSVLRLPSATPKTSRARPAPTSTARPARTTE